MVVGACKVVLRLPENHSLKGKRQVVKSLIERVKGKFNAAVAEVDNLEAWQLASIGITVVSNDTRHADEMISKIVDYIGTSRIDAEIEDFQTEIIHAL